MRLLAIILPLLLLALVYLAGRGPRQDVVEPAAEQAAGVVMMATEDRTVRWIGHDWVEGETPKIQGAQQKLQARRQTFGLDAASDAAECIDPNCRACLIDFVYGREF